MIGIIGGTVFLKKNMLKAEIKERLNESAGEEIVKEIIFV